MKRSPLSRLMTATTNRGIVVEHHTPRHIEMTTPDGSMTAVCTSIRDAVDTYNDDPAFHALPLVQRMPHIRN